MSFLQSVHLILTYFVISSLSLFFFFNDTATTEIYTLSLHDALPISDRRSRTWCARTAPRAVRRAHGTSRPRRDRKSTRLNSSHTVISYAVFCLKKKKIRKKDDDEQTTVEAS